MVYCTTNNGNHNKITLQPTMDTWTWCQKSPITTELQPNHYPPKYCYLRELIDQLKGVLSCHLASAHLNQNLLNWNQFYATQTLHFLIYGGLSPQHGVPPQLTLSNCLIPSSNLLKEKAILMQHRLLTFNIHQTFASTGGSTWTFDATGLSCSR